MSQSCKINHVHRDTELESIMLLPDGEGPFPTVLLFHEYTGLNEVTVSHAKRLAAAGYAVLAADFYGVSNRPANIDDARSTHRIYRNNRQLMRERAKACLAVLLDHAEVDPERIFVLGFSFGGGAALELARTGGKLRGAVSVYGYLDSSLPVSMGDIEFPLLAVHVNNDPVVPEEHLLMFKQEMQTAEVEYDLIQLDNAQHGFANPEDEGFDAVLAEEMWNTVFGWLAAKKE